MPALKVTDEKTARKILAGVVRFNLGEGTVKRRQDDTDGSHHPKHSLSIAQGPDGDMHIWQGMDFHDHPGLRFRTYEGGGRSLATHNALRLLALAFKMDAETRHDSPDVLATEPHEMSRSELYKEVIRLRQELTKARGADAH